MGQDILFEVVAEVGSRCVHAGQDAAEDPEEDEADGGVDEDGGQRAEDGGERGRLARVAGLAEGAAAVAVAASRPRAAVVSAVDVLMSGRVSYVPRGGDRVQAGRIFV